ncbi:MAG TPA: hypothetical protein VF062_20935 [Candidatus Limnocylindrales bacterium]
MKHRTLLRALVAGLAGVILAGTLTAAPAAAEATAGCDNHPGVPDWFYPVLLRAAENPNDAVPTSWGSGDRARAMMKILCNESSFDVGALNPAGPYYGLGQLGRPAIDASNVRFTCYWHVDNDCSHTRRYYQALGALRYANQRYGGPLPAWSHWQNHGWW